MDETRRDSARQMLMQLRFRSTIVCLASCAIVFSQQPDGNWVEQADHFKYTTSSGSMLRIKGVCSMDSAMIDCWDPDGTPDKDLTDYVSAAFLVSSDKLSLKYGGTNRMVITESRSDQRYQGMVNVKLQGLELKGRGSNLNQMSFPYQSFDGTSMTGYWVYPEKDEKTLDFQSTLSATQRSPIVDFPPKDAFDLGRVLVKLGSIPSHPLSKAEASKYQPFSYQPFPYQPQPSSARKLWLLPYTKTVRDQGRSYSLSFEALDAQGAVIGATDNNGRPASYDPYRQQTYYGNGFSTLDTGWIINVDPKYIKKIQCTLVEQGRVEFPHVVMEPTRADSLSKVSNF